MGREFLGGGDLRPPPTKPASYATRPLEESVPLPDDLGAFLFHIAAALEQPWGRPGRERVPMRRPRTAKKNTLEVAT